MIGKFTKPFKAFGGRSRRLVITYNVGMIPAFVDYALFGGRAGICTAVLLTAAFILVLGEKLARKQHSNTKHKDNNGK